MLELVKGQNQNGVIIYSSAMQMESQTRWRSPQNIPGAWRQNSVAASSWMSKVEGDLL